MIVLVGIVAVAAVLFAGAALLRPRLEAGGSIPDVPAAKAAGDALLASRDTTVLVVVAHPDDAEWWSGGTIAALARRNHVVLVMGTSGDRGAGGGVAGLAELRERLQREGGAILGYDEYVFLRHPDQGLADAADYPGQVEEAFRRYRPGIVLTFDVEREGPVYHHPDHRAAGHAALRAARAAGGVTLVLQHTGAPNAIVDYAPVRERKRAAFAILADYRGANPWWGWLIGPLNRSLGRIRGASYGSRASFPEVGVTYGEVFRIEQVPPRSGEGQ